MAEPPKHLVWLDPFFQAARPTTQSLFQALPYLLDRGWHIELWCLTHDALDARVKVVKMRRVPWLRLLEPLWFWLIVWLRKRSGSGTAIFHASGPDLPDVDVMSVHFHNRTWLRVQRKEPSPRLKDKLRIGHTLIGLLQESLAFSSKGWQKVLPVSRGLAGRLEAQGIPSSKISVLPNLLDRQRFHIGVRTAFRERKRAALKANNGDYLFLFVSTGHYHRKGLWHAVRALAACRKMAKTDCGLNVRLVVVGASDKAKSAMEPLLETYDSDWASWINLIPPVADVEQWYAAADAFIFPSRYETFSLVAMEAAACGLPLLVTPYDGHEMYLRKGLNGILLPWDAEGMETTVARFLKQDRFRLTPGLDESLDAAGYADHLEGIYQEILSQRRG